MKKRGLLKSVFTAILISLTMNVRSQLLVELLEDKSSITIQGTSSLHNWEEKVQKFDVDLVIELKENKVAGIHNASVICESSSIESGNSIMNNKTHDALKAEKHPRIIFKLISVDKLNQQGHNFTGVATGDLTVAGKTKRVQLNFQGSNGGKIISIKGSKEIRMTEFAIEPPTALMGTLKTGDEITISFNLHFQLS